MFTQICEAPTLTPWGGTECRGAAPQEKGRTMKKLTSLLGCLAVAGMVLAQAPTSQAQVTDARPDVRPDVRPDDPAAIAERCVAIGEKKTHACARAVVQTTKRCVRTVKRLVEAGRLERARRVAAICEDRITKKARRCTERIEKHCVRCVTYLDEIGEPELAERVKEACSNLIDKLVDLVQRALNAIANALGGGDGAFDESI